MVIPLNDGLLSIIGEAPADKNCLIFDLPTYESCCKSVKRWVKRAGIDKHISWHCASHSKFFFLLNISELSILKNVTANDLETSYILFLSQLCNIQRTL